MNADKISCFDLKMLMHKCNMLDMKKARSNVQWVKTEVRLRKSVPRFPR
jgi:hypothetical protein